MTQRYKFTADHKDSMFLRLSDDAAATRAAVAYGYDDWTAVDEEGNATPTEFDVNTSTEVPEGISGADYVVAALELGDALYGRDLCQFIDSPSFPDAAAQVTETVHSIIIGLRKAGVPTHTESFSETLGIYLDLLRETGPGVIEFPTAFEVFTVVKRERANVRSDD